MSGRFLYFAALVLIPQFTSSPGRVITMPEVFAPPDIWSWSFNDGTLGWPANGLSQYDFWNFYYNVPDEINPDVQVVADSTFPTAIESTGYSQRSYYKILSSETPDNIDRNRYTALDVLNMTEVPGATTLTNFFVRFWVKLGTTAYASTQVGRKLCYIIGDRVSSSAWSTVIGGFNDVNGVNIVVDAEDVTIVPRPPALQLDIPYTLPWDVWRGFECEMQLGTPGGSDGVCRLWIYDVDGSVLRAQTWTGLRIRASADSHYLELLLFGNQADRDTEGKSVDEYRYDNRLALSTQRIGP